LEDYFIGEGYQVNLILRRHATAATEGLQEKVDLTVTDIKQKVDHWRKEENMSFDHDMEIVDPAAYSRRLDLLCDALVMQSEFKRCEGQYLCSDENTWTAEPALIKRLPVPSWMWDTFETISLEGLPHQFGSTDDDPLTLASLWKTSLILSNTLSNLNHLAENGFSNASFNLLLRIPGSDVIEIIKIRTVDVQAIQKGALGCLQDLYTYRKNQGMLDLTYIETTLWARIVIPCQSLLKRLHSPLDLVKPYVTRMLALGRITALLLDLALVSYSGSHGIRFDDVLVSEKFGAFEVDWKDTPFGFRCALARLACLDDFLDRRKVWAFELRAGSAEWKTARKQPCSLLTKMDDFADIWGPVYAVPGAQHPDKVRQYNVSKGIICRAGGQQPAFRNAIKCHFTIGLPG
jgi:hypothetical protein